jgi:hypothetical protein
VRSSEHIALLTLAFVVAAAVPRPAGQRSDAVRPAARPWTISRTAWGDPDIQGAWTSDSNFSIPLERPADVSDKVFLEGKDLEQALARRAQTIAAVETGGTVGAGPSHWYETLTARSARSSLIVDPPNGRLPAFTPAARQRAATAEALRSSRGPADSWEDRSLWDRCVTVGLPYVMFPTGYNNNVRIVQAQGYVAITHEMIHDTRVVPWTAGRICRPPFASTWATRGAMGRHDAREPKNVEGACMRSFFAACLVVAAVAVGTRTVSAQRPQPKEGSVEARLQLLEDKQEIHALLMEYGRTLDARDFAGFERLSANDGEFGGIGSGIVKGPAAIRAYLESQLKKNAAPQPGRDFHLFYNETIDVKGDRATAVSKGAFYVRGDGNKLETSMLAEYHDELVREDGRWKFKRRILK